MKGAWNGMRWHFRLFIFLIIAVLIAYGALLSYRTLFGVGQCSCSYDQSLSPAAQKDIQTFIQQQRVTDLAQLSQAIQEKFHQIKAVQACHDRTGVLRIVLDASEPKLLINNEYVLCKNGAVVVHAYIPDEIRVDLAAIATKDKSLVEDLVFRSWAQHLPIQLCHEYAIVWVDQFTVYYTDQKNKAFHLVCDAAQYPDVSILNSYQEIKNTLSQRNGLRNQQVIADARFDRQIIVRKEKGGWSYG